MPDVVITYEVQVYQGRIRRGSYELAISTTSQAAAQAVYDQQRLSTMRYVQLVEQVAVRRVLQRSTSGK
jgi:hypothetical protein